MSYAQKADDDDGVINLRQGQQQDDEPEFRIDHLPDDRMAGSVEAATVSELEQAALKSYDKVKVKFDKFVNLIATHSYEEIFEKHQDQDVIISTDLLADLANAHEDKGERKLPVIFLLGILLGIVLTWLLLRA